MGINVFGYDGGGFTEKGWVDVKWRVNKTEFLDETY
jgi:hypothetical protein